MHNTLTHTQTYIVHTPTCTHMHTQTFTNHTVYAHTLTQKEYTQTCIICRRAQYTYAHKDTYAHKTHSHLSAYTHTIHTHVNKSTIAYKHAHT